LSELDLHHVDMLQLALNSTCLSTASAAVQRLQLRPLEQRDAHRLLLTAAASQSAHRLLSGVMSCQHVQRHLDAARHEAVITLLVAHSPYFWEEVTHSMLEFLLSLGLQPAAEQLAREVVARLMLTELQRGSFEYVQCMLADAMWRPLPDPQMLRTIASGQVESMLLAAIQGASQQRTNGLRSAQLLSKRAAKLARVAAAKHMQSCVRELCKLPGAAELSSTTVAELLQAALQLQDWGASKTVAALCELPPAAGISAKELVQLLQAASAQCRVWNTASDAALDSLYRLLAARYQRNADAAELIAAAWSVALVLLWVSCAGCEQCRSSAVQQWLQHWKQLTRLAVACVQV
jgi:hypothetical protein